MLGLQGSSQKASKPLPNENFFSYVIVRPTSVLSWPGKHREVIHRFMTGITAEMKNCINGGTDNDFYDHNRASEWLSNNSPVYLSDGNAATVVEDLQTGIFHTLVLSARGRGWEPVLDHAIGFVELVEEVLKKDTGCPHITVVTTMILVADFLEKIML